MLRRLTIALSCTALATFAGCNTSDFSGKSTKDGARAPVAPEPVTPVESPVSSPSPSVEPSQPAAVTIPPAKKPTIDLGEIIGGLIKIIEEVAVVQPDATDIIFGGDKVFHIGDAHFGADSECASEIKSYKLKGTRYFFEFQVLEANTAVDVSVNKICGVDYNLTNNVHLQDSKSDLEQKALPKQITSMGFTTRTLQPGKYIVVVESLRAGSENPSSPRDFDDFIVGEVRIKADKPIKPGRVGAK